MKIRILMLGITLSLFVFGCSKEDNTSNNASFTTEEAMVNSKIDVMNDDISQIVEDNLTTDDGISGRNALVFASCATVTRVPAYGTSPSVGTLITKTIDFGTTGCTLFNGNIVKGKIIISFVYDPNATSHTINYQFENFYHNNIKFDGNKSFTRVLSAATTASPSHTIVTMNMNLTAMLPDGRVFTRIGTRVREIIEGYNTAIMSDNVYKITGSWTTTFPNQNIQNSVITSPLIIKFSCAPQYSVLSKGIITFTRNNNTATLDYGDGTCDNLAIFTINGNTFTIVLNN